MPPRKLFSPLRIVVRSFYRTAPTEELLSRYALEEDGDAFTVLVERFRGFVLRRCRTVLRCEHQAQDAAQETFVALARKAHRLLGPGKMIRWLDKVATSKALDIQRRERRKQRLVAHAMQDIRETSTDSASDRLTRNEMVEQVSEALRRLPQKYRQVLELCFLDGLTQKEAAAILGKPAGTIAWRVQHGLERLKIVLSRRGIGAVALGALPILFAQQAEAGSPVAARMLAEAALAVAESASTSVKAGLLGFLSYRGWAAVLFLAVVMGGGSATAWWFDTNSIDPKPKSSVPAEQIVFQETLQQKNLRILDEQILPKVIEVLKLHSTSGTEVVVISRFAYDHRVHCVLEARQSPGKRVVKFAFDYDPLGAEKVFSFGVDLYGEGRFKQIDPNRPIILGRNPFTGKEVVVPVRMISALEKAFREMPLDDRACEERTKLWEKHVLEDGREGLFPGPILAVAGNSKHLYLITVHNWLWVGDLQGPNRRWHCIGPGGESLAVTDKALFTYRDNRLITRPAEGIGIEWREVCSMQDRIGMLASSKEYLFFLAQTRELFGRRLDDNSNEWISLGLAPSTILCASGETLFSESSDSTYVRPACLTPAQWVHHSKRSKSTHFAAVGRFWWRGEWGNSNWNRDGCWSCPISDPMDSWRFEGPIANMLESERK